MTSSARRAAQSRLARRLSEAVELLAPAGITITPLTAEQAVAVLRSACNPDSLLPRPRRSPHPGTSSPSHDAPGPAQLRTGRAWNEEWDEEWDEALPSSTAGRPTPARPGRPLPTPRPRRGGRGDGPRARRQRAEKPSVRAIRTVGVAVCAGLAGGRDPASRGGLGVGCLVRGHRVPARGAPGLAGAAADLPGPGRRIGARRPGRPGHRGEPAAPPAGQARVRAAFHGRARPPADPQVEAATEDAYDLSDRVARGEGKLFRVGLYLTVHAATETGLADEVAALRALTASLLLDARPATFRSLQGWVSTLPLGLDQLGMSRTFDTAALGAAFPFTSPTYPPPTRPQPPPPPGCSTAMAWAARAWCTGIGSIPASTTTTPTVLGRSGSGKSYFVSLSCCAACIAGSPSPSLIPRTSTPASPPQSVAPPCTSAPAGSGSTPSTCPSPPAPTGAAPPHETAWCCAACSCTPRSPSSSAPRSPPPGEPPWTWAIAASYRGAGITGDPRTWTRPAPTLRDLRDHLADAGRPRAVRPDPAGPRRGGSRRWSGRAAWPDEAAMLRGGAAPAHAQRR